MMDADEFRRVMGHFPTGVTVVTTRAEDGRCCGLTVNAFCSVSLDPTLVLVCIERESDSHDCLLHSRIFAVSVLEGEAGETLSRRFSSYERADKFDGVAHRTERTGSPVLDQAMAWLDCRVVEVLPAGDHTIFVGEALDGDAREGDALVYYRGGYGTLER